MGHAEQLHVRSGREVMGEDCTMPEEVVLIEYKSGRKWLSKEEWDKSQWLKSSPNIVRKAIYKKVENTGAHRAFYKKGEQE